VTIFFWRGKRIITLDIYPSSDKLRVQHVDVSTVARSRTRDWRIRRAGKATMSASFILGAVTTKAVVGDRLSTWPILLAMFSAGVAGAGVAGYVMYIKLPTEPSTKLGDLEEAARPRKRLDCLEFFIGSSSGSGRS